MSFRYYKEFTKKQNILFFMQREQDGATTEQIAEAVFGEMPPQRAVNVTYSKAFFVELERWLDEMLRSGHLESEGDRFFFKQAQTDVPLDDGLPEDYL